MKQTMLSQDGEDQKSDLCFQCGHEKHPYDYWGKELEIKLNWIEFVAHVTQLVVVSQAQVREPPCVKLFIQNKSFH